MDSAQRQAILGAYYSARRSYDTLASELRRLLDPEIDPSVPAEAIYTIKHRLKDEGRLVEKLEEEAATREVTAENFALHCKDILGIRIVCLRLSDVDRVEVFLQSLADEGRLRFQEGPERKKTFILQVDPREKLPRDVDLQYTGYSSIHYVVSLGEALKHPPALTVLRAELQVRTLLEEAWGEIDHKYRYELSRAGAELPEAVNQGFYSFAAYLQAAALQVEYLCMAVDKFNESQLQSSTPSAPASASRRAMTSGLPVITLKNLLKSIVGFTPTRRTINYVARRLMFSKIQEDSLSLLSSEILSADVLKRFGEIFYDVARRNPFSDPEERDIDLINALNFALVRRSQGETVAEEGLRDLLTRRLLKDYTWLLVFPDNERAPMIVHSASQFPVGTRLVIESENWVVIDHAPSDDVTVDGRVILGSATSAR